MKVAHYRRLARAAPTANALNQLHIAIENRVTPSTLAALRDDVVASPFGLPEGSVTWIRAVAPLYDASGKTPPEPFVRRRVRTHGSLYRGPGSRAGKTLMVAFSGKMQRLMMPTPIFLQHLAAVEVDVALLPDIRRTAFVSGIAGLGEDLCTAIARLPELLEMSAYRRVVTLGVSGGGIPALLTAYQLGLSAAMAVGAHDPHDPRWVVCGGRTGHGALSEAVARAAVAPRAYLVVGAEAPRDGVAAAAIAEVVPSTTVVVTDPAGPVDHNALRPLAARGELGALLARTVFAVGAPVHSG